MVSVRFSGLLEAVLKNLAGATRSAGGPRTRRSQARAHGSRSGGQPSSTSPVLVTVTHTERLRTCTHLAVFLSPSSCCSGFARFKTLRNPLVRTRMREWR